MGCPVNDGESYADILKTMKAKVNPQNTGAEVLAFQKALDQGVRQRAGVKSLVSKRSLEVRDLDETIAREEVVAALCITLGKPDLGDQCRLHKRFSGVHTAVVCLTEADTRSLLGLGKLRVKSVSCRIREHVEVARCFRC